MAGVRIRHVTARTCTYTLVDASRPLLAPLLCAVCVRTHTFKTYHIRLDDNGAAIVSPEVAERIGRLGPQTGFTVMNEVLRPPAQNIALAPGRPDGPPVIADPNLKEPV
jgi:hypothetical protein